MTNTDYDTALLQACKHYMRITDSNPKSFINELCELAGQYCENLPENILFELENKANIAIQEGKT